MPEKQRALIFDFDGVIADSFDYFAKFLAGEIGKLPLGEAELVALRGLSLKAVGLELGHPFWRLPGLYYLGRRELANHIYELKPFTGIVNCIKKLFKSNARLFIVSSNSTENIEKFLENYGLENCFEKVYGNVGFGGKSRILARVIRQNRLARKSTYYVCDEVRDLIAARHARVKTIAVTWGYNTCDDLARLNPSRIITSPSQLVELLQ